MNCKGQFSIIAALLVAVVLVGTVITTYATLRQSASQEQPQVLTAIDETNLALDKVLGFTVGYYGSVLQVTGDSAYAKNLTETYLRDSLGSLADIKPEWGAVFTLVSLDLSANWFTNASYSAGEAVVDYSLPGLGISGMSYKTSCRLDVQVSNSSSLNQACLTVLKDANEPLINLGRANFKFYRYLQPNASWGFEEPSGEFTVFANGTYVIGIPTGMGIDASDYMVQVTDTRGIMVAAASFSRITASFIWNTTSALPAADYVDSSTVNVGVQSNFAAQQFGPDGISDTLTENVFGTIAQNYNASEFNSTSLVSGLLSDLQSDNGVRMVFRSYVSGTSIQTFYAHQETTTIGGTPYYTFKTDAADASGLTLTAQMSSSRVMLGKSVYRLQGISSIPESTWTVNYRAWQDPPATEVAFDSASSVEATSLASSVMWAHTTGAANNRLLVVAVSVHSAAGTPATVSSVTYGGVALTQVTTALYSSSNPQVRTYVFRLVNPQSGTQPIAVTFSAPTLYICGAATYANVDPNAPIQTSATATGSSSAPSVEVSATGTGRAVFGHVAGDRQVAFKSAGAGSGTTGNPTPSYPSGLQANDLILLQVTVRDTSNTPTTPSGFTLLHGPDSTGTGTQWIYYRFATGSESGTITVSIGGSSCKIARMYSFRNVALSSFTEGGSFGSGSSSAINARSVTTSGSDRLAVSFVFVNDDNVVDSFTGETGGDWTEATSEFRTSAGSDGCVQLQIATVASAGTISGGSYTMGASDPWGVRAFALKPTTNWTITEGGGQNNRWTKETYLFKGRGSDRLNVTPGTVAMSWSTSLAANWVCSAVVINPVVPVAHCDVDVLIRRSDGSQRSVIATNVANSGNLTSVATTLSGTYSWGEYTVVDQTDYLEVDYYAEVTVPASLNAYLRIDDSSLALSNQTRIEGILIPSEYTSEVEFMGTSNMQSWTLLNWATDSNCTAEGVTVTAQLYNYQLGRYALDGEDGYNSATIGASDVSMTQNITANPTDFRNSTGGWRLKFKAVKSTSAQFYMGIDLVRYRTETPNYALDVEEQWTNVAYAYPRQDLCIKTGALSLNENLTVDICVNSSSCSWVTVINALQANQWNNVSVTPYINSSTFTIRFRGNNETSDPTQDSWDIDAVLLNPQPDVDTLLKSIDHVITVELLQNGTMRWLGQNLYNITHWKPIPPVPVKAIHVNQTVNGVEQEVPFQVEDWASEYRIPLGLTNNATVFSSRQMIVFLVNVNVSEVTVWWDGRDTAIQTSLAYTNRYFSYTSSNSTISNGKISIQFGTKGFNIGKWLGSTHVSNSTLMRTNSDVDDTDPELAYVIVNGTVRDIVHGEPEWRDGGIPNCANVYASTVFTLPANATYYTYQLRLIFIDSTDRPRTITDLCPIKLSTTLTPVTIQTENGTVNTAPIVANGTGIFKNYGSGGAWTAHHWSQCNSTTGTGAGILFTNASNQLLYAFDPIASAPTGSLNTSTTARTIEFSPVTPTLGQVSGFGTPYSITWYGAVAAFNSATTPVYTLQGTAPSGLWLLVEYPPKVTVTSES